MCGDSEYGQLGTGLTNRELIPVPIELRNIKEASAGKFHTLFVSLTGIVFATGRNAEGQLGIGSQSHIYSPVQLQSLRGIFVEKIRAGYSSACITEDSSLYVWGHSVIGNFLQPYRLDLPPMREVKIGGSLGVGLSVNGDVYTWGGNSHG